MKHSFLVAALSIPLFLAGCDTPDDCGNPFGCKEQASKRMTSSAVAELIGVDEPTAAILLDNGGHVPERDERSDELLYELTSEALDEVAMAVE